MKTYSSPYIPSSIPSNRALRTKEKRIHRHLYLAMLIQVVIRLILYIDQLVSRRGNDAIGDVKVRRTAEAAVAGDADLVRGIDNTVSNLKQFLLYVQGDRAACAKPAVDFKTKVLL